MQKWLLFVIVLLISLPFSRAQNLSAGSGTFAYSQYSPLSNKPIQVHYYIPTGATATMPILFALHGEDRVGSDYRQDWISAADQHKFIVVAPEFPDIYYTGGDGYNLANIFVNGDSPTPSSLRPDSVWTFAILDPLFNYVKQKTGSEVAQYFAFGHSAGSQLLHRFVLYKPDNLMKLAICANAGWYTVPQTTVAFPYGLAASPFNQQNLKLAFGKKLIVLLGGADVNPNSPNLRHNQQADAQGLYRLARGRYFFTNAQNTASAYNTPFNWRKVEVAGVGHDHTLMAKAAVPYIVQAFDSIAKSKAPSSIQINYSNQSINIVGLLENESYSIQINAITGQEFTSIAGLGAANSTVALPKLHTGLYFVNINTGKHGLFKRKIVVF